MDLDKKGYKYFILAFFVVLSSQSLFYSCDSSQKQESVESENEIEFESISIDTVYSLQRSDDSPICNLNIDVLLPTSSLDYDVEGVRNIFMEAILGNDFKGMRVDEAVEKYAQSYIANYKRDAEIFRTNRPSPDYGEEFDDLYHNDGEHANLPDVFYSYFESISDTIVYNHHGVLSFQVTQTNNKGGEISHESVTNYVINLANGELINEDDIFVAGYDLALRPIIQNALMHMHGVKSVDELEDLGYFGIDEIIPNGNFLITDKGIIYTFNKGEYSAYQLPSSQIIIPFSYVRSILRESSIAKKLLTL